MREGRRREENKGTSSLQGGDLTATTNRRETLEELYRKMGKAPMAEGTSENTTPSGRRRDQTTPPPTRYARPPHRRTRSPSGQPSATRPEEGHERSTQEAKPWRMWTAAERTVKEVHTSHATLTAILDETRRTKIDREIRPETLEGRHAFKQT